MVDRRCCGPLSCTAVAAVVCALTLCVQPAQAAASGGETTRPLKANVVFFLTDDQDQVLGGSFPHTAPNDATPLPKTSFWMSAAGATATNFYIHTPIWCAF